MPEHNTDIILLYDFWVYFIWSCAYWMVRQYVWTKWWLNGYSLKIVGKCLISNYNFRHCSVGCIVSSYKAVVLMFCLQWIVSYPHLRSVLFSVLVQSINLVTTRSNSLISINNSFKCTFQCIYAQYWNQCRTLLKELCCSF